VLPPTRMGCAGRAEDFLEVVLWRGVCPQDDESTYLNSCLRLLIRADLWWYLQLPYVEFTPVPARH
jgi:hypothetical protein